VQGMKGEMVKMEQTYASLNLSFSFGSPIYSDNSCIRILIKIRLDEVVSSSFSLMNSRICNEEENLEKGKKYNIAGTEMYYFFIKF
jgi:hypothetical protein